MRNLRLRSGWVAVWLVTTAAVASGQRSADPQPDYDTLKRLARQLGGPGGQGPIDPALIELAKKYLEQNPQLMQNPQFREQLANAKEQLSQNPGLAEQLKSHFTPDEMQNLGPLLPKNGGITGPGNGTTPRNLPPAPAFPPPIPPDPPTPDQGGPSPDGLKPFEGLRPGGSPNPIEPSAYPPATKDIAKELAAKNQDFGKVANFWEQNVGPLDSTPALKQSLVDMFSGGGSFSGPGSNGLNLNGVNGGTGSGGSGKSFWDTSGSSSNGSAFGNWLKGMTANGGPKWWKNMSTGGWGKSWLGGGSTASSFNPPSTGGGFGSVGSVGSIGGSAAGLGTFGLIVVILIAAAVIGFLIYRYWPQIQAMRNKPQPIPGFGPWPLDPRDVKDRETLVRAFEYVSVAICGDGARVWNHVTIADAFREHVPGAAPFADQLARLYAVARYTPAHEVIRPEDISEARGYLCRLAGVTSV